MGSLSKGFVTVLFLLIRTIPPIIGDVDVITITSGSGPGQGQNSNRSETSLEIWPVLPTQNETLLELEQEFVQNSTKTTPTEKVDLTPIPPLPPQKLVQSLESKSVGGSSESLQNFLKTSGFSFAPGSPLPDPIELKRLLARLKPKQGRFDPALLEIINNSEGSSGFLPSFPHIFGHLIKGGSINQNLDESPEGQGQETKDPLNIDDLWSPSLPPRRQPPSGRRRNRFSSKFSKNSQKNGTLTTTTQPPPDTAPRPNLSPEPEIGTFTPSLNPSPQIYEVRPFSHITDPNLRNHRLYDWELEKNFTTLDQMEDLLAQSSEHDSEGQSQGQGHGVVVGVKPPPALSSSNGWKIPQGIRPVSMEGTQFDSSGDLGEDSKIPSNKFVRFPTSESDSADVDFDLEPEDDLEPFNLLRPRPRPPRIREPLRESSTENLVFSHRGPSNRYRSEEGQGQSSQGQAIRSQEVQDDKRKPFRPSPADKVAGGSPPVFVDPDQDFFTSTIRSSGKVELDNEPPQFIRPMRRLPDKQSSYPRTEKRKRRPISEEAITDLDHDPRPYPEDDRDRRPSRGSNEREQDDYTNSNPTRKSDRILDNPGHPGQIDESSDQLNTNSQSELRPTYYNFYPVREFGPASNEHEFVRAPPEPYAEQSIVPEHDLEQYQEQYQEYPSKDVVLGHNGEQIYAGGYHDKFHHPFAASDSQPEYSSYSPNSNEGWSNTYWILGGLIALSALTAFVLPVLLNSMGRNGKIRNDLQDENLEYTDDQTSPASETAASSSTLMSSLLGDKKKKPKPKPPSNLGDEYDNSDPTADSDLWSEIKGVYNDVVKIVRGDYGGIVDKLSGGYKDKDDKIGPNIVYRDDDALIESDGDLDGDQPEDDFDYESIKNKKQNLSNRKGKAKPKGKKNRNINSSINYVVANGSPPNSVTLRTGNANAVDLTVSSGGGRHVDVEETSRAVPAWNDTMATFYLGGAGSSSSRPFSLFTSPPQTPQGPGGGDPDSFMGEWAKVQLIGS